MRKQTISYGLVSGMIGIIISLISFLFFQDKIGTQKFGLHSIPTFIGFIIGVYLMVRAALDRKKEQRGFLSFSEGLKESFLVKVISALLITIFTFISQYILFPDVYKNIQKRVMDQSIEKWDKQGLSEEQIESSINFTEKMLDLTPYLTFPMFVIGGFFMALIIAAIIQKKNPEADFS